MNRCLLLLRSQARQALEAEARAKQQQQQQQEEGQEEEYSGGGRGGNGRRRRGASQENPGRRRGIPGARRWSAAEDEGPEPEPSFADQFPDGGGDGYGYPAETGGGSAEDVRARMMEEAEADFIAGDDGGDGGGWEDGHGTAARVGKGGYNARSGEDDWVYDQPGSADSRGAAAAVVAEPIIVEPSSARAPDGRWH